MFCKVKDTPGPSPAPSRASTRRAFIDLQSHRPPRPGFDEEKTTLEDCWAVDANLDNDSTKRDSHLLSNADGFSNGAPITRALTAGTPGILKSITGHPLEVMVA